MKNEKWIYVDESGNDGMNLEKDQVSSFYVLVAIVINSNNYDEIKNNLEHIKKEMFQKNQEMKSSAVADDFDKRKNILTLLCQNDFSIYTIIVDKRKLTTKGFYYPKSFIKYFCDQLYKNIFKDFRQLNIFCDKIKSGSFMDELKSYLDRKYHEQLFNPWKHQFLDSKQDIFIQAADFISGTIRRCFEKTNPMEKIQECKQILNSNIRYYNVYPPVAADYIYETNSEESKYDYIIEERAIAEAYEYLAKYQGNDNIEIQNQIICLSAILKYQVDTMEDRWISTNELLYEHQKACGETISEQKLRNIIGRLRSAGVLIASRGTGGYKIPVREDDLYQYLNKQNTNISPMLFRVKKSRETILRATDGELDILDKPAYKKLKQAIDAVDDWTMECEECEEIE